MATQVWSALLPSRQIAQVWLILLEAANFSLISYLIQDIQP